MGMDYEAKKALVLQAIRAEHPAHFKIAWMREHAYIIFSELRRLQPQVQSRYGQMAVRKGLPAARVLVNVLDILESIMSE